MTIEEQIEEALKRQDYIKAARLLKSIHESYEHIPLTDYERAIVDNDVQA